MSSARVARVVHAANPSGILVIVAGLALWQVLVVTGVLNLRYLPAPSEIGAEALRLAASGQLFLDMGHTLGTTLIAGAIGAVIGIAVGIVFGLFQSFRLYTASSIDFFRTIPVTALVPVALLIWGPSNLSEVVVAAYAATWPILINTAGGVRSIPTRLYDVAAVLRLPRRAVLTKLIVPAAAQQILVGLRLGIVTALVLAIVAEMLINPQGLGWGVILAQNGLAPARLWAYTLTIGVLAYLLNMLLVVLVRLALPGSARQMADAR